MKYRHALNPIGEGAVSIGILAMNIRGDAPAYGNQRITRQHRQTELFLRSPPDQALKAAPRLHANSSAALVELEETIEGRHILNNYTLPEACRRVSQAGAPGDPLAAAKVGLEMAISVRSLVGGYKRHRTIEGNEASLS
jgi:hypothetical protein